MVALKKPYDVKVTTQNGECQLHITLDLNINLTTDKIEVSLSGAQAVPVRKGAEVDDDDVHWTLPDFENEETEHVEFGKEVENE